MDEKRANATLNISGDSVKKALAKSVAAREIKQDQADLIWWFFAYCKSNRYSLSQASRELGYESNSTLWRLWNGTYGAKVDNICAKIARYRAITEARASQLNLDFVETSIARRVFKACEAALISQTIVFIYGDSQIGKTRALQQYAALNNHGQTKYIRMPASAGVQLVAREFARACFVSTHSCFEKLRDRILDAVDDKTLLIVDEVHQAFLSYQRTSQVKVLEFIREIYDRTQCGMVLCGTNVLKTEIQEGKLAIMLEQLRRRCTHPIQLPSKPPKPDIEKIAAAFKLPAPDDDCYSIIRDMIYRSGLGMYIKYLQAAARMAGKEKRKLTWDHFVQAHDLIAKLSVK